MIRLFLLTSLTMIAFASNSLLNRLALAGGDIGPSSFSLIRVCAGAAVLVFLLMRRKGALQLAPPNIIAVLALAFYMVGFSQAYVSMDAGLGALILFGVVQLTMFAGSVLEGDSPPLRRWLGMGCAMTGLAVLTNPFGAVEFSGIALVLMTIAAIGWGIYSLQGRGTSDPIAATGWNFVYCLPLMVIALVVWPDDVAIKPNGVLIAIVAGGVTSALGYALWYSLLPNLGATRGALVQLSVPAIAMVMGALFLAEQITFTALLSAALILGGIAIGLLPSAKARQN